MADYNPRTTWRLECAAIIDALATARFVKAREDWKGTDHDPMHVDTFDRIASFPDGMPIASSTVMMRGAQTLRWTEEYARRRGQWRRGRGEHY